MDTTSGSIVRWGDRRTHSQKDLQGAAEGFDVGIVKQATSDGDDMMVLQGQAGVQDRCHQTAWPILHPPGAVQRCVEGHDEVPVLGAEGPRILSPVGGILPKSQETLYKAFFTSELLQQPPLPWLDL